MKTTYKVLISFCIGVTLIAIGVSMGGLSQMRLDFFNHFDWRWDAERINDVDYQTTNSIYEFDIDIHSGTVKFIESDNDRVEVKANTVYDGFEVYQTGNTLVINQAHYWKWFRSYDRSQIEIYVPKDMTIQKAKLNANAGSLKVYDLKSDSVEFNVGAGNLSIENVKCQDMKLDVGMGNANADNVLIQDTIKISVGMGNTDVELIGNEDDFNYKAKVGLGSVKIGDEKITSLGNEKSNHGTTDRMIDINCGMGRVKVDMEG
ncbi:MAG: DUF4097 family beta strand repeat-containing protein [Coprobacillus sp.]